MKIQKWAALYAVFMGVAMIGMWIMFYLTAQIPELETKPVEIGLHLSAEFMTAVLLIVGGVLLYQRRPWGYSLYLVSMGMLIYTVVMSPGYFLQQGEYAFGVMFGVFLVLAVGLTLMTIRSQHQLSKDKVVG